MRERENLDSNTSVSEKTHKIGRFKKKLGIGAGGVLAFMAIVTSSCGGDDSGDKNQDTATPFRARVERTFTPTTSPTEEATVIVTASPTPKPTSESTTVYVPPLVTPRPILRPTPIPTPVMIRPTLEPTPVPTPTPTPVPLPTLEPTPTPSEAPVEIRLEAETIPMQCTGEFRPRSNASNKGTIWLRSDEYCNLSFKLSHGAIYTVEARYSNDGGSDTLDVTVDRNLLGQFTTVNTREPGTLPGTGWNVFKLSGVIGTVNLSAGEHNVLVKLLRTDGAELDVVILNRTD